MAVEPVPGSEGNWTVDDYMALDEEQNHELIRGRLVVTPSPTFRHQHTNHELARLVGNHVDEHDLGYCVEAPADVVLGDDTVLQPDFLFVSEERFPDLYDGHSLTGPPDLVAEVLSPGTVKRDRIEKMDLYGEAGVEWLLFVDPDARFVEVFRLEEASRKYRREDRAADDEVLTLELFPELEVELSRIWFEAPESE
jgi:Uma2 family endonuclease